MSKKIIYIGLIIVGIIIGGSFMFKTPEHSKTLRVAFPVARKSLSYEPTNIHLAHEYIFLENVFSTLIEMDAKGVLQPGIAEKAEWINNELKLTIRSDLKTASGKLITADDVMFSLKRLLVLTGNTHGNFKDLVCPTVELKSIDDTCPGLRMDGNSIYLSVGEKKPFLIPMLSAIDFAVIPRSSCDPKTLAISNLKETSGPYFVSSDDENGNIELTMNPNHYHAADNIPQRVKLVPMDQTKEDSSVRSLLDNKVDLLTTIDTAKSDQLIPIADKDQSYSLHTTLKIRTVALIFTDRGMNELSIEERRFISEKVKSTFTKIYENSAGYENRNEFFPNFSDGGLSDEQQAKINSLNNKEKFEPKIPLKIGLMKRGSFEVWADRIKKSLKNVECVLQKSPPDLIKDLKPEDVPHAFVLSTDTGFKEDISLISYSLNAGFLGLKKNERAAWLTDYMGTDDRTLRMTKLKKLHFEALKNVLIVPMLASPYAAIVRKPWKPELSELFANNQLWLIKTH